MSVVWLVCASALSILMATKATAANKNFFMFFIVSLVLFCYYVFNRYYVLNRYAVLLLVNQIDDGIVLDLRPVFLNGLTDSTGG